MQTQVISQPLVGTPWLERFPEDGGAGEKIRLDGFPFTIGRNESCSLPIDSAKVSREHAAIQSEGGRYWVEDLGSTNGTLLNGQRIDRAVLGDGDVLMIANVQFSFFLPGSGVSRTMATQVLDLGQPGTDTVRSATEIIAGVRRLGEVLNHRAVNTTFQPIVDLARGRVLGYAARGSWNTGSRLASSGDPLMAIECRLTGQIRRLERIMAVEAALEWPGEQSLFVRVHASEFGDPTLLDWLVRLRQILPTTHALVAELPDSAAGETPFARELCDGLRRSGVGMAIDASATGATRWSKDSASRPDYLLLDRTSLSEAQRNAQRRRQLESIIQAGREAGCDTVASDVQTEDEAALCRILGARFGRGDHFGPPQPIEDILYNSKSVRITD
ncbi:MAG: EAL domain-containing protein [Pirellulales bacterium]|nr:EAL domain-containing protein [Pirellulales bacterium]